MSEDIKNFKINKLDFGVNIKRLSEKDPSKKPSDPKKDYLKSLAKFLKTSFKKIATFHKFLSVELSKRKKLFSRSIFLGRGFYFKYIANLALLLIILVGAFAYLSFDKNDTNGFLSKYSGIASSNSGFFVNTGVEAVVTEKQFKINSHIVSSGDTLSSIAARYSTEENVITVDSILWANGLKSGDILKPGMVLQIPPVSGVIHTVQKNDTVISIAKKYKLLTDKSTVEETTGAVQQIIDINLLDVRVVQDNEGNESKVPEIVEGQRIIIPGGIIEEVRPAPVRRVVNPPSRGATGPVFSAPVIQAGASFAWPVQGGIGGISQGFKSWHQAIDIANRSYPNLVAMASGTVTFAGRNKDFYCGINVQIRYDNGFDTIYCHMDSVDPSIANALRSGQAPRVVAGQVVGKMGRSGSASGVHVHLALRVNGKFVNPCGYSPFKGKPGC